MRAIVTLGLKVSIWLAGKLLIKTKFIEVLTNHQSLSYNTIDKLRQECDLTGDLSMTYNKYGADQGGMALGKQSITEFESRQSHQSALVTRIREKGDFVKFDC